jgi:Flp pilus assembly protein TadG
MRQRSSSRILLRAKGAMSQTPSTCLATGCAARGLGRLRSEDGSALVEYAVVFILFMMMLLGIMDFGRALYTYHFVSNAAREATRFAAVHGYTCDTDADGGSCTPTGGPVDKGNEAPVQNFVTSITPLGIDSTKVATTPTWPVLADSPTICSQSVTGIGGPYENYPGCTVRVTVSYPFNFLFPLVGLVGQNPLTLSSTSEMVIAH